MNAPHVAHLHGVQPCLLFKWAKHYQGDDFVYHTDVFRHVAI